MSPSSVRRVLEREGLRLRPRPLPRPGRSVRKPFPDWVEDRPKPIWIYATTHFTRAGMAVTATGDLVSRKWLCELVWVERPPPRPRTCSPTRCSAKAPAAHRARHDGLVDPSRDDPSRPILLASATTHRQMTSGSTRQFMALCAIHQHVGRPGTRPTRPGPGSLPGHVKAQWPT